jgi:hypothetical protein
MNNWFSGLVTSTAFKYLITAVSSWLAAKLGVAEGDINGILVQLIGVATAVWGVWEASRNKVVLNGEKAIIPPADKPKAKTLIDLIKSKQ